MTYHRKDSHTSVLPPRTFESWKKVVDQEIDRRSGLSADNLPDWDYRKAWDAGLRPATAAVQAIRSAKGF